MHYTDAMSKVTNISNFVPANALIILALFMKYIYWSSKHVSITKDITFNNTITI